MASPRPSGDDWRAELDRALAVPGKESWRAICRLGSRLSGRTGEPASADREYFRSTLAARLPRWPEELDRECPAGWPSAWKEIAERRVREVDTYGRYVTGIESDPRLRLRDGTRACQLRRRFVGAARTFSGGRPMKVGEKGEPDVQGFTVVELVSLAPSLLVPVATYVEVKRPDGDLDEDQRKFRDAILRKGAIYVAARTVEEAVLFIVAERRRLTTLLGG